MRSVFNIAGAIVLTFAIFSPSLVFAADQFRNVGLGESFAKEWAVLACHPAKKELTLSHRYRFGKSYGLVAETVSVGGTNDSRLHEPESYADGMGWYVQRTFLVFLTNAQILTGPTLENGRPEWSPAFLYNRNKIQFFFGDAGGNQFDADGVAELIHLLCSATDEAIVLLVILKIIVADRPDIDHAIGLGSLFLHVQATIGDARNNGVKFFVDAPGKEFHLLHLDRIALGVGGRDFAFGGMERERVKFLHFLCGYRGTARVCFDKPVDDEVGVAAYRRREMRVEIEPEAEVPDVLRRIHSFAH